MRKKIKFILKIINKSANYLIYINGEAMKKILIVFLGLFSSLFLFTNMAKASSELASNSKAAILMEAGTGDILFEKNIDEHRGIASMTKIMTISLVYDALKAEEIKYDTILSCSAHAKSMGGTQVYLEEGEKHSVSDLIKCVMLASANDAAVCLAEGVAGSEALFVDKMNQKALELNMKNTHYSDATGLSDENHFSSAYDMAIISKYLLTNYPEVLAITRLHDAYFREDTDNPFWLVNTNKLAGKNGIDGLKTGHTAYSGYCITLTKEENNMRLISVVMGYENPIIRNQEASELLSYGFSFYKKKIFLNEDDVIKRYNTILFENDCLKLTPKNSIVHTILKSDEDKYELEYEFSSKTKGKATLYYNGSVIETSDLIIKEKKKKSIIKLFLEILAAIF